MAENDKTYLSKEKYGELVEELNYLRRTRRAEIARQLEQAKEFGDLSENAEYHEAREEQTKVEARILDLEILLKNVEIVKQRTGSTVGIGSKVIVARDGEERTYEIVGSEEADVKTNKISFQSPLGKAMMGKKKGDPFTFATPSGKELSYKIKDVV